ncbi:hypothetical protein, partial [Klebsiella pneumoniae]|uniref:hypothetical protein n=1 Tax=Klebsiella pneumoniae TaxID=573 RepID=UPI003F7A0F34
MNKVVLYCRPGFEKECAAEITDKAARLEVFGVVVKFFWTRRSDGRVMHRRATGRQGWPAF